MSYLSHLKRSNLDKDTRWIVKTDIKSGKVREVKQIFDPEDYKKFKRSRTLYNKKQLIEILENDRKK
jgi:hypothetical protein